MGIVLIYVEIGDTILDYRFYSRELAPINLDDNIMQLIKMKESKGDETDLALLKIKLYDTENATLHDKFEPNNNEIVSFTLTKILPEFKCVVPIDAHVASCAACEFHHSSKFRRHFLKFAKKSFGFHRIYHPDIPPAVREYDEVFDSEFWIRCVIEVIPQYSKQKIDYAWNYRIEGQVAKRAVLEEAMAWLSTLGGGFSSLGDYFDHHAKQAGTISVKQLKIAIDMGDPVIASKCKLFFAQSLMQRGFFKESKRILRLQTRFAESMTVKDEKLLAICRCFQQRLKYLIKLKSTNNINL